ncbi:uncharacterized protein LOC100179588 [Ciona intestinalis]
MVKASVIERWNLPEIGYEQNEKGNVTKIYCKLCKQVYADQYEITVHGAVVNQMRKWVDGTGVIKKFNAIKHLESSGQHRTAVLQLGEAANTQDGSPGPSKNTVPINRRQIKEMLNEEQKQQLIKKFQVVHFMAANTLSFRLYPTVCHFLSNKETFDINLGLGYRTDKAASEILQYLSQAILEKDITEPLNTGSRLYFSILFDGSYNAKNPSDKKEVFVIKTCQDGVPTFDVLSIEDLDDINAAGFKAALNKSVQKAGFTFIRQQREIGLGGDATATNNAVHRLEREDLGDHVVMVSCPSHKVEMAIHQAFDSSAASKEANELMTMVYGLFKSSSLRWRLFKRTAAFLGMPHLRFKPCFNLSGTSWVGHQTAAIETFLFNLPTLIEFCSDQLSSPHNNIMKKDKSRLEGVKRKCTSLKSIIMLAVKHDVLNMVKPCSLALKDANLLMPCTITAVQAFMSSITCLMENLQNDGGEALNDSSAFQFLHTNVLPNIQESEDSSTYSFHSHKLSECTGGLDATLQAVSEELRTVVHGLVESLTSRLQNLTKDPIFVSAAMVLDVASYGAMSVQEIRKAYSVVEERFHQPLTNNKCIFGRVETEIRTIQSHHMLFLKQASNEVAWQQLFRLKKKLQISNALQIVEICMVLPFTNAKVEHIFSSFTKKQRSERLNNKSELALLRICGKDSGYEKQDYSHAVNLFLTAFPDGKTRKKTRRLEGYDVARKKSKLNQEDPPAVPVVNIQDTSTGDISSEAWSDTDDEKDL